VLYGQLGQVSTSTKYLSITTPTQFASKFFFSYFQQHYFYVLLTAATLHALMVKCCKRMLISIIFCVDENTFQLTLVVLKITVILSDADIQQHHVMISGFL